MVAALLISIGTTKVGVMQGEVEKPIQAPQAPVGTSLVNQEPVKSNLLLVKTVTGYANGDGYTPSTITASGEPTHLGVIAANWLPLGTKVRLPQLFGNQVFTVEDRMAERYNNRADIWFPSKEAALQFGVQRTTIEIL